MMQKLTALSLLPIFALILFSSPCTNVYGLDSKQNINFYEIPSCCCCEMQLERKYISCCDTETDSFIHQINGAFIYLPPECAFDDYLQIEFSDVMLNESLIISDIPDYIFKPPKA